MVVRVEIHAVTIARLQFLLYLNLSEGFNDISDLNVVEVDE
jgi:hypothetical protein